MAITAGMRIGVLQMVAPLGQGGMGQVWRALDTSLGRAVAVKLLPDAMAEDPDRLARFEREAKTLAALNHPNIATVYGFETSTARHVLVMELVDGEDLSQRIVRGAVSLEDALRIAKQVAEALAAAHEQGVVHRDLKPSNIMIRTDGAVKVLDFGLAKVMEHQAGSTPETYVPTLTAAAITEPGAVLGTAAYMSPEQARGIPADRRADLWSFGVMLWELLTRRRPFAGATTSDTLAAVLTKDPDWTSLPADTPQPIRRLLRRCLEKDRRHRLDSAGAALLEIDDVITKPLAERETADPAGRPDREPSRIGLGAAVVVAAAVAAAAASWVYRRPAEVDALPEETRVEIVTPATADPMSFALSPDGRQIVFSASDGGDSRLWLRSMAQPTAEPLAGTEGGRFPFWSPDSRSIGFFAAAQMMRLSLGGGTPVPLATTSSAPRGGTWNAAGVIVFAPTSLGPLFQVPAGGGTPVPITSLEGHTGHGFPSFLPDGRRFVFYASGPADAAGIHLGTLGAPAWQRLTAADSAAAYVSLSRGRQDEATDGWLLWARAGALVGQRLDRETLALTGQPETLAEKVAVDTAANVAALSATAGGVVAYRPSAPSLRQLIWRDRSGNAVGTVGPPDDAVLLGPDVSVDGHIAASRTIQGNTDIWLIRGEQPRRFTFDVGPDRYPIWSSDGRRVVFVSNRGGRFGLYVKAASGVAQEEALVEDREGLTPTDWSADGRYVFYNRQDPKTGWDLWVLPMEGPRTPWPLLRTPHGERQGTLSPDGAWVAYLSNESGRPEIYVRAFAPAMTARAGQTPSAGQWQVSTDGGIYPRWSRDGKALYYIGPTGSMMTAAVTATGDSVQAGQPVALFSTRLVGGGVDGQVGRQYAVASDGRFVINSVVEIATPITLIQNWRPAERR